MSAARRAGGWAGGRANSNPTDGPPSPSHSRSLSHAVGDKLITYLQGVHESVDGYESNMHEEMELKRYSQAPALRSIMS